MKKLFGLLMFLSFGLLSTSLSANELPEWLDGKSERVVKGFNLYVDKGCMLCHGTIGQGSPMSGMPLASNLPLEYIRLNVRQPRNQMPLYLEETLSDEQLELIVEFIHELPEAPSPDEIELLKRVN